MAWSQAYHYQGNERAESAGEQVRDIMRRLVTDLEEPLANWVELRPKALRLLRTSLTQKQVYHPMNMCLGEPEIWLVFPTNHNSNLWMQEIGCKEMRKSLGNSPKE